MIKCSSQTEHCTHLALSPQDFSCDDVYMVYLDISKFDNFDFWDNFFPKEILKIKTSKQHPLPKILKIPLHSIC